MGETIIPALKIQQTFAQRSLKLSTPLASKHPVLSTLLSLVARASFPRRATRSSQIHARLYSTGLCRQCSKNIHVKVGSSRTAQYPGRRSYHQQYLPPFALVGSLDPLPNPKLLQFLQDVDQVHKVMHAPFTADLLARHATRLLSNYSRLRTSSGTPSFMTLQQFRNFIGILLRAGNVHPRDIGLVMEDMVACGLKLKSVDWGRFIMALGRVGDVEGAVQTFERIRDSGAIKLDRIIWNAVIEAFSLIPDPVGAERYYAEMMKAGCRPNPRTLVLMIDVHERSANLDKAEKYWKVIERWLGMRKGTVAQADPVRSNLPTYNHLIKLACERGQMMRAMEFYNGMVTRGEQPSLYTFTILLNGFAIKGDAGGARMVHERLLFMGMKPDIVFYSTLMNVYAKMGDMEEVTRLLSRAFQDGIQPDVTLYNILMKGYGKVGNFSAIRACFDTMIANGIVPDRWTYGTIVDAHVKAGDMEGACEWFRIGVGQRGDHAVKDNSPAASGALDAAMYTSLIDQHGRQGDFALIEQLFLDMEDAGVKPTVVTYTIVIHAHLRADDVDGAIRWFHAMKKSGVQADAELYGVMVAAFSARKDHDRAQMWMEAMEKDKVRSSSKAAAIFIDACLARRDLSAAVKVYENARRAGLDMDPAGLVLLLKELSAACTGAVKDEAIETSRPNEASTKPMTLALAAVEPEYHKALIGVYEHYQDIMRIRQIVPVAAVYETMVNYFLTRWMVDEAKQIFIDMLEDGCPISDWTVGRISRSIARNSWTSVVEWVSDVNRWISREQKRKYAKRDASEEEGMQTLWKEGLMLPKAVDEEANQLRFDAAHVERLMAACVAFTYGKYALWAATVEYRDREELKAAFRVVHNASGKRFLKEKLMSESGTREYWEAVLRLLTVSNEMNLESRAEGDQQPRDEERNDSHAFGCSHAGHLNKTLSSSISENNPICDSAQSVISRALPSFLQDVLATTVKVKLPPFLLDLNLTSRLPAHVRRGSFRSRESQIMFAKFCRSLIRHCELHGLWNVRRTVVEWLLDHGWQFDSAEPGGGHISRIDFT